ncbi:hypothetical protein WJX79_008808 [Trebouxia sp. C0005]
MRSDQAAVWKGLLDLRWRHADLQSLVLVSSSLTRQRPRLIWQNKDGMTSFSRIPDPLQEKGLADHTKAKHS